jgi:hypothetical protein
LWASVVAAPLSFLFRLNKDDRTLELPEDPSIGAAFQRNALRQCAHNTHTHTAAPTLSHRAFLVFAFFVR